MYQKSTKEKTGRIKKAVSFLPSVLFALTLICFFAYPSYYTHGSLAKGTLRPNLKVILAEAILVAAAVFLVRFRAKIQEKLQRLRRLLMYLAFFVTPFITFEFTYIIIHTSPRNFSLNYYGGTFLWVRCFWYNILIIFMIQLFLLLLSNNLNFACSASFFIGIFFCTANYYIQSFRGIPILVSDFTMLGTAMEVAGNYSYKPSIYCLLLMQAWILYVLFFRCLGRAKLFSVKKRLIFSAAALVALAVFVRNFVFSDYLERQGVEVNLFKPMLSYWRNGPYVTMVRSFQYMQIDMPEGYSAQQVAQYADAYPSDAAADAKKRPNIIVIIDEAFCDLGVLTDLHPTEDFMPFLHSLQKKYTHGYTYASELGKGTANSEFEVLTGNCSLLVPQTCIAFQLYIKQPMPSLVSLCASMGYQGLYACHPFTKENYNRPAVYPLLGFQTYLSKEDFDEDAPKLRNYLSDLAVNDMIIQKYEEAKASSDDPFFFYTMTMQNHSGYTKEYENLPLTIELPDYPDLAAQTYVNLVKHTDEAMEELTRYFEQQEDPTVILFLGDHQPTLTADFFNLISDNTFANWSKEEEMKRYAVPFILWSNFDLPMREYEKTSMNYLQAIMADLLDFPMTGYQKYLLDLMKDIPAITANGYWGADGNFYELNDSHSPYYQKVLQYSQILYNTMFEPDKRPEGFFELN